LGREWIHFKHEFLNKRVEKPRITEALHNFAMEDAVK